MTDSETIKFYSSKPRLIHMAINILCAPILLYLLGVGVAWIFDTRRKASKESSEEPEATPPT